ncbi:MAG TPA: hypothetical protein VGJ96_09425 [Gemmatimonadaceae bacterium]|jgi:hypothetical protein
MLRLVLAWSVWLAGSSAQAQAVFQSTGDVEATVQVIYKGLFAGVTLPKEVRDSAVRVIRAEHTRQVAIDGRAPGAWDRRIALNRWRDSTLRVLLRNDADRKTFNANAERLRPQGRPPQ